MPVASCSRTVNAKAVLPATILVVNDDAQLRGLLEGWLRDGGTLWSARQMASKRC